MYLEVTACINNHEQLIMSVHVRFSLYKGLFYLSKLMNYISNFKLMLHFTLTVVQKQSN
jgi:hypothetical protein